MIVSRYESRERPDMALEADAAEQEAELTEHEGYGEYGEYGNGTEAAAPRWTRQVPDEVNEADAAEQEQVVELDEDDYR